MRKKLRLKQKQPPRRWGTDMYPPGKKRCPEIQGGVRTARVGGRHVYCCWAIPLLVDGLMADNTNEVTNHCSWSLSEGPETGHWPF